MGLARQLACHLMENRGIKQTSFVKNVTRSDQSQWDSDWNTSLLLSPQICNSVFQRRTENNLGGVGRIAPIKSTI